MALVDDDDVEIIRRILALEEGYFFLGLAVDLATVDAEAVVGGDLNPRIARRIAALGVAPDFGRFAAEKVGKRRGCLRAQFVAIADEQGAPRHASVEQSSQHLCGDEGLAGPGGERQQRALLAACDLLEHGADRCVLIVAARAFAAAVRREQGPRGWQLKIDLRRRLPFLAQ